MGVVIRCGTAAPRTGPQQRSGDAALAAAVGRTAGSAAGAFAAQGWTAGRAVPLPGRLRMPAWPKRSAGLAGLRFVKSGPRLQDRLCRQAKAELRPLGPFPRRKTRGHNDTGTSEKRRPGATSREFKRPFRQKWPINAL